MNTQFAQLCERVELIKEEARYFPGNLSAESRVLIAICEFQRKLIEAESKWERGA